MPVYASIAAGCRGQNHSKRGAWQTGFGIGGLGLDLKMSGPLRTRARSPSTPSPRFPPMSRSCCGAADPAECVDRDPADQHKHWHYCLSAGKQKLWRAVCGFMRTARATSERNGCIRVSICPLMDSGTSYGIICGPPFFQLHSFNILVFCSSNNHFFSVKWRFCHFTMFKCWSLWCLPTYIYIYQSFHPSAVKRALVYVSELFGLVLGKMH